jgi:hypothetical protein
MLTRFLNSAGLLLFIGLPAAGQSVPKEDTAHVLFRGQLGHPTLRESSGLAHSGRVPGLFWTINDSGNPAELFATDSTGRDLGLFRVTGAENVDWETLARGRCGPRTCLYIGDVGDNRERRDLVMVYRVFEPESIAGGEGVVRTSPVLRFRYEDGPQNVEAMFIGPDDDVYLITKERRGPARVYRVEGRAWRDPGAVATAGFVQQLPLGEGLGYQVTDASLAEDGTVALRTYRYLFFFRLANRRLETDARRARCEAGGLDALGEAVDWIPGGRLATTSERLGTLGGTVSLIECR